MKTLFILTFLIGIFSCSSKNITDKTKPIQPYFIEKEAKIFNLNDEKTSFQLGDYELLRKNKVDTVLFNFVKSRLERYYDAYYYSILPIQQENVVLYAYHDYYRDFILVTFMNGKPIDAKIIATVSGDGGDFYCKYSEMKEDHIESKFEEGYESFSEPIDTIYYSRIGSSKIFINAKNQIIEDTLKITLDSIVLQPLKY